MNLLVTGKPGTGKSTLVRRVIEKLDAQAGGFVTTELRQTGMRVGFEVRDLVTGETAILAHVDSPSRDRVGKYGVDVEAFERVAIPAVSRALLQSRLVVIDEIGKMELFSRRFREAARRALDHPKPLLGVIQAGRSPFLDLIRIREDTEIYTLTPPDRADLEALLLRRLTDILSVH